MPEHDAEHPVDEHSSRTLTRLSAFSPGATIDKSLRLMYGFETERQESSSASPETGVPIRRLFFGLIVAGIVLVAQIVLLLSHTSHSVDAFWPVFSGTLFVTAMLAVMFWPTFNVLLLSILNWLTAARGGDPSTDQVAANRSRANTITVVVLFLWNCAIAIWIFARFGWPVSLSAAIPVAAIGVGGGLYSWTLSRTPRSTGSGLPHDDGDPHGG